MNKNPEPIVTSAFTLNETIVNLPNEDKELFFGHLLGAKLVKALNDSNLELINAIGIVLEDLSVEVILSTLRYAVGLELVVKHQLDDNPIYDRLLIKLTNKKDH